MTEQVGDVKTLRVLNLTYKVGRAGGGIGAVALNLAVQQNLCGADSRVWSLDCEEERMRVSASSGMPEAALKSYPYYGPAFLGFSPAMERAAAGPERCSFDILHQHGLWTAVSRVTNAWRSKHKRSTIVAPHGALQLWSLQRSRLKKKLALAGYERKNLHSATCLHACSAAEVAAFRDFGLRQPVALIPNGISSKWVESEGDGTRFRQKFGIAADRRLLLFLSRIHPSKGLDLLIDAMSRLKPQLGDWVLVIAGADEVNTQAQIRSMADRLGLSEHVKFTGPVFDQDKRDAFVACELFILPTLSDNFGIAVIEALGAGRPALVTKGAPWEELTQRGCGWWVDTNSTAIAEGLGCALHAPRGILMSMGAKGKALVSERYMWRAGRAYVHPTLQLAVGNGGMPGICCTGLRGMLIRNVVLVNSLLIHAELALTVRPVVNNSGF